MDHKTKLYLSLMYHLTIPIIGIMLFFSLIGLFTGCGNNYPIQIFPNKNKQTNIENKINDIEQEIDYLNEQINDINIKNEELENELHSLIIDLATIQMGSVAQIYDPCGDNVGEYDEILLIMGSGDIVGYFEDKNNKRFLTILPDGLYVSTDKQKCYFSIVNSQITNEYE